jgi:excinuclease ABC subunit C
MTTKEYREISNTIPKQPGVYRFLDEEGKILYVGKAKKLKNRLDSYFGEKKHQYYKTRVMVKNADHIEYTIVETESDALLLENTLIKKFQPRYNVDLKDGKSYSYIVVKKERFPRVFLTRKVIRDGSTYFGPYTSKGRTKVILDIVKKLFPLRTCSLNLSQENIDLGKFKVCLEFHIKNCMGPCVGLESEEEYNVKIEQVKNVLRGHFKEVKAHLKEEMKMYADQMEFEKAHQIKDKLNLFTDYQAKSTVVSQRIRDVDVFSIATDEKFAYVNFIKVVNGAIINTHTVEMTKNLNQNQKSLLAFAIPSIREKFNSVAPEIVVPFRVKTTETDVAMTVPQRGEKRQLLELSAKNVKYFLLQKQKEEMQKTRKQTSAERILRTLKEDLNMEEVPLHIECFDNSNIQGSYPVAACVVFKNARPSKKDYRHYKIKTVEGPDDFASMEEIVYRRYARLLHENQPLPQLVVIDGGKGQLSAAVKSLVKLKILDKITVIGIAKKLEEIYFPGDSIPLYINKKSESLKIIQQTRNEAHRFAITFHRNQRSKDFTKTELTDIPGVGAKSAEKLLSHFGSIKKMKAALPEEIKTIVGSSMAGKVIQFLTQSEETGESEKSSS